MSEVSSVAEDLESAFELLSSEDESEIGQENEEAANQASSD